METGGVVMGDRVQLHLEIKATWRAGDSAGWEGYFGDLTAEVRRLYNAGPRSSGVPRKFRWVVTYGGPRPQGELSAGVRIVRALSQHRWRVRADQCWSALSATATPPYASL
jgi:hypothetical protein